jgi:hypothetical protein
MTISFDQREAEALFEHAVGIRRAVAERPTPRAAGAGELRCYSFWRRWPRRAPGGLATNAFGQAPMLWHERPFMGGPFDPVQVDRHVERLIKYLAVEADATADQQAKFVPLPPRRHNVAVLVW